MAPKRALTSRKTKAKVMREPSPPFDPEVTRLLEREMVSTRYLANNVLNVLGLNEEVESFMEIVGSSCSVSCLHGSYISVLGEF